MEIQKLKKFLKKRYIFGAILVALIVFSFLSKNGKSESLIEVAKIIDLKQTVLATGQVVSETDIDLSFNSSGIVKKINVKVGDKVYKGKVLASLDQGPLLASLTQAKGALLAAEAKYQNTISGSSDQEVALAKILLENAKKDYDTVVAEQDAKAEKALNDFWKLDINPNYAGAQDEYIVVKKARDTAIASAQSLIDQRQAELDVKLASATDSEIALAKADMISAVGQVELANANLENSIMRAPDSGTITKVDIKLGELSEVNKKSITIEDVDNLYIEAKINEANISSVKIGDPVSIVYDSLGPDKVFSGSVVFVDPSSTEEEGVVNYKIKVDFSEDDMGSIQIKPGMNADIIITTFEKPNTLVVPVLSTINKDGISYLKVLRDSKKKSFDEIPVSLGERGDGNMIEVIEGANEGDKVVVNTK